MLSEWGWPKRLFVKIATYQTFTTSYRPDMNPTQTKQIVVRILTIHKRVAQLEETGATEKKATNQQINCLYRPMQHIS